MTQRADTTCAYGSKIRSASDDNTHCPALAHVRSRRIAIMRPLRVTGRPAGPAPAIGFHHTITARQHVNAGAPWSRYTADGHTPQ